MSCMYSDMEISLLPSASFAVDTRLPTTPFAIGAVIARVALELAASAAVFARILPSAIAVSAWPFITILM